MREKGSPESKGRGYRVGSRRSLKARVITKNGRVRARARALSRDNFSSISGPLAATSFDATAEAKAADVPAGGDHNQVESGY